MLVVVFTAGRWLYQHERGVAVSRMRNEGDLGRPWAS